VSKSIVKRSDIINGRGYAAPPKINIAEKNKENYHSLHQRANIQTFSDYKNNENSFRDSYSYPPSKSYLPRSEYDYLKKKLYDNDKLRSYIKTLKNQLMGFTSQDDQIDYQQQANWNDYGRQTAVQLPNHYNYDPVPRKSGFSHEDTDLWLKNRNQPKTSNIHQKQFQEIGDDAIITVDNIHKFVEPPRGPDTYTINVESNLNFSG